MKAYRQLFEDYFDTLNPEELFVVTQLSISEPREHICRNLGVSQEDLAVIISEVRHNYYQYKFCIVNTEESLEHRFMSASQFISGDNQPNTKTQGN
jgi:hypothetical protein